MHHAVDRSVIATGPKGEVAHRDLIAHSAVFEPRLHRVTDRVHCAVGFGLANATLIVGPEGAIVVDSGKNVGEAEAHQAQFDTVPGGGGVRAVLYSHSHYIDGTSAYRARNPEVEVWGHEDVDANHRMFSAEAGPRLLLGALRQFGFLLPPEGPDAMPNYGLGPFLFGPTADTGSGYLAPDHTVAGDTEVTIAGVRIALYEHASDSEDTLVIHLPDDDLVINNHVWPSLFNIFTMRGEPYRDPNVHLAGIDRILELDPEHLVGVHGPPVSGRENVRRLLTTYRDSIQFIWDQTVRGMNLGLEPDELVDFVQLPESLRTGDFNGEFYGVVPHHVRQVHSGVAGWFGAECTDLYPLAPAEEAVRIVAGFGGRDTTVAEARKALEADDPSWALQLATWVLRTDDGDDEARAVKVDALRLVAQTTTSSNVRAFCLSQALELEGAIDWSWAKGYRIDEHSVLADPIGAVRVLRVLLDPRAADGVDTAVRFRFTDLDQVVGLHVRNGVAAFSPTEPPRADLGLELTGTTWAALLTGAVTLHDAVDQGTAGLTAGSLDELASIFSLFDDLPESLTTKGMAA